MGDRFDIQRRMDSAAEDMATSARERLEADREAERQRERRLVKLSVGYYFDPVEKVVLRKSGTHLVFVRHDRRRLHGKAERKASVVEAEKRQFRMITGGLFWDEKSKKLYIRSGQHFVLYTRDRRKVDERRKAGTRGKERRAKR